MGRGSSLRLCVESVEMVCVTGVCLSVCLSYVTLPVV